MLYNPTVGMRIRYRMTPYNPGFNGEIATITKVNENEDHPYRLSVTFDNIIGGKRYWTSGPEEYDPLPETPEEEAAYQALEAKHKAAEVKAADDRRRQEHAMKYL